MRLQSAQDVAQRGSMLRVTGEHMHKRVPSHVHSCIPKPLGNLPLLLVKGGRPGPLPVQGGCEREGFSLLHERVDASRVHAGPWRKVHTRGQTWWRFSSYRNTAPRCLERNRVTAKTTGQAPRDYETKRVRGSGGMARLRVSSRKGTERPRTPSCTAPWNCLTVQNCVHFVLRSIARVCVGG